MTKQEKAKDFLRMGALIELCKYHKYCYYVLNKPEVSDSEYDGIEKELILLASKHRDFIRTDLPDQYVDSYHKEDEDITLSLSGLRSLADIIYKRIKTCKD